VDIYISFSFCIEIHIDYSTNNIRVTHPAKMRRHKTVAQIFLVLSVVNFTFAGLVQTRTMHEVRADLVTGAEGVTQGASEKPHTPSEELSKLLERRSTGQDPPEPSNSVIEVRHTTPTQRTKLAPRADPLLMEPVRLEDPEATKFFNEELKRKMKEYVVLGTIAGIFAGFANGIQKQIMGTVSPGAYVFTNSHLMARAIKTF